MFRVSNVWRIANFTDRMYLSFYLLLSFFVLLLQDRVPGWPAFLCLHLVCVAIIVSLVINAKRFSTAHGWYPLMMPILTFEEVAQLNFLFVDGWRDDYILAFEGWLFPEPPTVWLSRFASPTVTEILAIGYFSYFLILMIVGAVLSRHAYRNRFHAVMAASTLAYLSCYLVFVLFPTEGPAHTLRHLHTVPLTGGPFLWMVHLIQKAGVHGNAFPSAHVAGAVAALSFAWRYARRTAYLLTPLVILLCIGAVYLRYHYASDVFAGLVVGVSAAFWVMFFTAKTQRR